MFPAPRTTTDQLDLLPSAAEETALLLANATEDDVPMKLWPRQLAALVDVLTANYQRRGREPAEAVQEAREVVLAMAIYFGGRPVYLPKGTQLETALEHAAIWHEFDGRNADDLAKRHNLTVRQVQKILSRQMRYRRDLRQRSLPFE